MKKFGAFLFVSTLLLTGCGANKAAENKVTCSSTVVEDGKKVTTDVNAELKDGKVSSVTATMSFDDEATAKESCELLAFVSSLSEQSGVKLDYKCDGKSIVINNYDALTEEEDKLVGLTKDEFIEKLKKQATEEETEITCK